MARAAITIQRPLYTSTDHRIDIAVFSDENHANPQSISGVAVTLVIKDAGGTAKTYTATAISASAGTAYVTITGASHTTPGTASFQCALDGIPKESYTATFITKLA